MEKINENIVLLCDTREADETVTLYSNNLEFSTKLYFDTIVESLKKSCNQLYVYDNPKEFMDNIATVSYTHLTLPTTSRV